MDKKTLKVIRVVERRSSRFARLLATLIWLAAVTAAFYANHRYIGDSTLFGLLVFGLALLTLVGIAKRQLDIEVQMTPEEALTWLKANYEVKN